MLLFQAVKQMQQNLIKQDGKLQRKSVFGQISTIITSSAGGNIIEETSFTRTWPLSLKK